MKEGTGIKRVNVNITEELHRRFKSATAAQGLEMTDRGSGVDREVCRQEWTCRSQERQARVKRAALYMRVSTVDQHPETQLTRPASDGRSARLSRSSQEYTDRISGAKAKRPGLDQMMADARRGRFDVVLVWACDRIARSVEALPRSARRVQPPRNRVRQLPGKYRYRRPAGPRHRRHHRRHR